VDGQFLLLQPGHVQANEKQVVLREHLHLRDPASLERFTARREREFAGEEPVELLQPTGTKQSRLEDSQRCGRPCEFSGGCHGDPPFFSLLLSMITGATVVPRADTV
jgi:hypothetical protein